MRLIDADALETHEIYEGEWIRVVYADDIDNTPTIEAEPVRHGRWEYKHFSSEPHCSLCLAEYPIETNYCHNCGAKMDGGSKNAIS